MRSRRGCLKRLQLVTRRALRSVTSSASLLLDAFGSTDESVARIGVFHAQMVWGHLALSRLRVVLKISLHTALESTMPHPTVQELKEREAYKEELRAKRV